MHTTHLNACLRRNHSNLAQKEYKKKQTTKRHYRDNRHQSGLLEGPSR